ncbi:MAG: Hsp20/alpha crystallin family protein [Chthoniobacterales bacterium]
MNALEKWNPMHEMEEMQNRLASFFNRRLPLGKEGGEEGFAVTAWAPPVDITEDKKEDLIKVELPGMNKEDVRVSVEGGVLSITGERKAEQQSLGRHQVFQGTL